MSQRPSHGLTQRPSPAHFPFTEAHARQYREQGYFVVPSLFPAEIVAMLREECAWAVGLVEQAMDAVGRDHWGLNHRHRRYIVPLQYKRSARLPAFLFGDVLAAMCQVTLGSEAYLFLEQFVIKGAADGMRLGWHQDAGYLPFDPPPYVTGWIPLDDVDEANGTILVLPYDRAGTRDRIPHSRDPATGDAIGYAGPDPGIPVIAPAGSLAVFSSTLLHRSGENRSGEPRRAYIVQYSAEPIYDPDGAVRHFADPMLAAGQRLGPPAAEALAQAPAMPLSWND
ncbi:MAG TPA: phytanoyl-CoA dioxygenase family protein [Haliangium sp.]|nr:phytanoyl-CoA dioxygenase family protein [Haliangium sp.]